MSDTNKTWIVLAMGLLLLVAAAPAASAEMGDGAATNTEAPQSSGDCVVLNTSTSPPTWEVYPGECT